MSPSTKRRAGVGTGLSVLAIALVLTAFQTSPPAPDPRYGLDDWMTLSRVSSFRWSPDGRYIYYTSDDAESGTDEIFRVAPAGGAPELLSRNPEGERPEPKTGISLSADGSTIVYTSARYFQSYDNIFRMPASGGPPEALTFNDGMIETGPALSPDGETLAYYARTGSRAHIFLRDLSEEGAWPRRFSPTEVQETSPAWSPDGRTLAFSRQGDIWVRDAAGGEARRIIEDDLAGGNGSFTWSPDGTQIAFTRGSSGFSQIGVVDVATGAVTPITNSPNDHGSVSWSPDGTTLAFVRGDDVGMSQDIATVNADGTGPMNILTSDRAKGQRSGPEFSPDGQSLAFLESTGTTPRDVWIVPAQGGDARRVTNSLGRIDPSDLSVPEEVFYPSTDSLMIPAILWRPKDFDPDRRYPVIVRLHGHPGQWNHGFQMMTQYFVDQGFVAIAPNPRGSRGFGQGFHDLHIADYGGMELDDVMSVLPYLESLGYVDMDRKATWGGSGGGYMSFVIATERPDAFQAQVIRAPVADWEMLAIDRYGASGMAWTAGRTPVRERSEFGGAPDEIPEEYFRRSPINFVENVEVPQLLFQGLRDSAVLPRQSRTWAQGMEAAGNSNLLTYHEYPHEDHGLSRYRSTVRDRLERMTAFFVEHLDFPALAGEE